LSAAELIDRGIRAYVAGRVQEARAAFTKALRLEPGNASARAYLEKLAREPAAREEPPAPAEEEYAPSPWDAGPAAPATIVLEPSGGLDLAAVADKTELRPLVPEGARPARAFAKDVDVWLAAAKELFALGDFSGSLELIEKILQVDADHAEARAYLRQTEATLISMYES
jgi:tetratricopeptide (TPR) repeat protein